MKFWFRSQKKFFQIEEIEEGSVIPVFRVIMLKHSHSELILDSILHTTNHTHPPFTGPSNQLEMASGTTTTKYSDSDKEKIPLNISVSISASRSLL